MNQILRRQTSRSHYGSKVPAVTDHSSHCITQDSSDHSSHCITQDSSDDSSHCITQDSSDHSSHCITQDSSDDSSDFSRLSHDHE